MEIVPKEVFTTINDATTEALRKKFGPPNECEDPRMMAKVAVATLQLSLLYFAQTGAPKEVVRDFFEKLLSGDGPASPALKQDGNRLIQDAIIRKIRG